MTVEPISSTTRCVVCAEAIDFGARKCLKCGAYQDRFECLSCGVTIPAGAERCHSCKALQTNAKCRTCGNRIEVGAKRCSDCGTWQNFRRFVPASQVTLALLVSLISVTGAVVTPLLNYVSNRSRTYVRIVGPDSRPLGNGKSQPIIRVIAANTGKKPSLIKSATISFDKEIHAGTGQLRFLNLQEIVVKPGDQIYLSLYADTIPRLNGKTPEEVIAAAEVPGRRATVTFVIEETDRKDHLVDAKPTHSIETIYLNEWMTQYVATDS